MKRRLLLAWASAPAVLLLAPGRGALAQPRFLVSAAVLHETDDQEAEAEDDRDRAVETEFHDVSLMRAARAAATIGRLRLASFMMNFGLNIRIRIGSSVCEPT